MARRRARSSRRRETSGWLFMLVGLGLGLVVAAGIYFSGAGVDRERQAQQARSPAARQDAPPAARPAAAPATAAVRPQQQERPAARRAPAAARETNGAGGARAADESETRFDFYDILPRYEVVVPEVESVTAAKGGAAAGTAGGAGAAAPAPVAVPGSYILQTGSFRSHDDADRMQASLALLGIESRIQKVTLDDDVFHRVRVGPISDLEQLNRLRAQLRGAGVDPLMMKVNE